MASRKRWIYRGLKNPSPALKLRQKWRDSTPIDPGKLSTKYVLETFLMSRYLYNFTILDDLHPLKETDEKVIRRLLNSLWKWRDKALTNKSLNGLISLLQIPPLTRTMEKETMRFVCKLTCVANDQTVDEDEGSRKGRLHSRRTLWLLSKPSAPTHLHNARMGDRSKTDWEEKLMRDWNTWLPDEGLRSRPIPKASKGGKPGCVGTQKTLRRTQEAPTQVLSR